jgi:hypothetical protein
MGVCCMTFVPICIFNEDGDCVVVLLFICGWVRNGSFYMRFVTSHARAVRRATFIS